LIAPVSMALFTNVRPQGGSPDLWRVSESPQTSWSHSLTRFCRISKLFRPPMRWVFLFYDVVSLLPVKYNAKCTRYFTACLREFTHRQAEGAEEEERGKTKNCFVLISSANLCGLCGERYWSCSSCVSLSSLVQDFPVWFRLFRFKEYSITA